MRGQSDSTAQARRIGTNAGAAPREVHRSPRLATAVLEAMAARMTWEGTSRKERRDKLPEAGKFAAAVRAAAMSNGLAVSLNIGIRREAMLLEHGDPKRRMTQALSKHLSPAGFGDLPYALLFEVAPERDFGRLHLHGVVDVSGLDDPGVERLRQALIRAASVAEGAIGGERQLDLRPIFDPVSWTDYILKYATRTAKEFGLDDPFMINPHHLGTPMPSGRGRIINAVQVQSLKLMAIASSPLGALIVPLTKTPEAVLLLSDIRPPPVLKARAASVSRYKVARSRCSG